MTITGDDGPVVAYASGCPGARHVAAYWLIGAPPFEVSGTVVNETVACRSAVIVALTAVGAACGGKGTSTCFEADAGPGPAALNARTEQT